MREARSKRALLREAGAHARIALEIGRRLVRSARGDRARRMHMLITGFPRSGTSLFYNMLSACLGDFEFDDSEVPATETLWRFDNRVSKRPFDVFVLRDVLRTNLHHKRIALILQVRDPRDVITSIYPNAPDDYLIGYDGCFTIRGSYPNYTRVFDAPGIGAFYRELCAWRESDSVELQMLRYEQLVADPASVQERLARELGLRFHADFARFHERRDLHRMTFDGNLRPLAPELVKFHDRVTTDYVGRWSLPLHRERIAQQFSRHPELFAMVKGLGYEKDDSWFEPYADRCLP